MLFSIQSTKNERKKMPLLLRLLGFNYRQEPVIRPNGMSFYQWFYCAKGKGEVIIDGEYNIVTKGNGFLLFPHTPHSYRGLTLDWTVHIIGFEGPVCGKMLSILGMYRSGIYRFKNKNIFLEHVQSLFFIKDRNIKNKQINYSKECYSFLLDISGQITPSHMEAHVEGNGIISDVIAYLENNFTRDFSLDELALDTNRSKEYLCTLFKKATGKTIIRHLTEIRILHAQNLLIQCPEKTVAVISKECGFSNASYFGKKFKQLNGTSPEKYRKDHL